MRSLLSVSFAALIAASSAAVTFAPAGAAIKAPAFSYEDSGSIVPVLNGHRVDGDGRPQGYYPNERSGGYWNHHRRDRGFFPYANFPFAFAPRHHRRDCYRDWDGRLYCARGY